MGCSADTPREELLPFAVNHSSPRCARRGRVWLRIRRCENSQRVSADHENPLPHPQEGDMASTGLREAPLHSSQKRQLRDAKAGGNFPSPQPCLWFLDVAARAGPDRPGQGSPGEETKSLQEVGGHRGTSSPRHPCSSSLPFSNQNSHQPQTASPFKDLQRNELNKHKI